GGRSREHLPRGGMGGGGGRAGRGGAGAGSRGAPEPSGCLSRARPSSSSAQRPPLAAPRSPGGRPPSHSAS
ncbi:unnamed protein product, partial [Rangifer tarandus platyrhynchus]